MVDYRFPTAGVDARFATLGADAFFPSVGVDARFATLGKDLRFEDPGFGSILPLDSLPAPLSGYSLRKIRTAYAGQCLRVRRSSDNTEQDIGFAGPLLDTAALLAFVGAGDGFVTIWYDQSGNARNLAQATAANQPPIVLAGAYLGEIRLQSGTTQHLALANAAFDLIASAATFSSVLRSVGVGPATLGAIWSIGVTGGARLWQGVDTGSSNLVARVNTTNRAASPVLSLPAAGAIVSVVKTASADLSSCTAHLNGGSASTFPAEAITPGANTIAINNTGGFTTTTGAHGHSEFIIWNSALSGADQQALARNQGAYFGIAVA